MNKNELATKLLKVGITMAIGSAFLKVSAKYASEILTGLADNLEKGKN